MVTYAWKPGARIKTDDVQTVGERLQMIHDTHDGLTPELVVADAGTGTSPLHDFFEWDDSVAAEAYRLEQAKYLLRHIAVKIEQGPHTGQMIRAFVVVESQTDNSYEPVFQVMENPEWRQQVLQRAWRELEQWQRRYQEYEELAEVFAAMEVRSPLPIAV